MTAWDDLNTRAHGLATHLLGRATLERLTQAPDLSSLAAELGRLGYPVEEAARPDGIALELAARRTAAHRLALLHRWAGKRTAALAIVLDDEDRRSISTLLRGAVQQAAPEVRLSGLLPTPMLPERALEELSRQPTAGAVATLLSAWEHPLAYALLPEAGRSEPDLLRLEVSLGRAFAERALKGARREGRRGVLTRHVQRVLDIENAYTALALAEEKDSRIAEYWLPGGRALSQALAERAVSAGSTPGAGRIVAGGFSGTSLASVFAEFAGRPEALERAVLGALIAELRLTARTDPLSPAFLLGYALRLRAEVLDVRRAVWGIALGAPAQTVAQGMVTPS
jgi:vacuolar-type H+-ATPase subunit C/Vma6